MSYELNFGWEGPRGDSIGFRLGGTYRKIYGVLGGGPIKAYITNLVQGSYEL